MLFDVASQYFFSRADGIWSLNQSHALKGLYIPLVGLLR